MRVTVGLGLVVWLLISVLLWVAVGVCLSLLVMVDSVRCRLATGDVGIIWLELVD